MLLLSNIERWNKNKPLHSPFSTYWFYYMPGQVKQCLTSWLHFVICCAYSGSKNTCHSFDCKDQLHISGNIASALKRSLSRWAKQRLFWWGRSFADASAVRTYPLQFKVSGKACVAYFLGKLVHTLEDLQSQKYFWYEALMLFFFLWNVCIHNEILVKNSKCDQASQHPANSCFWVTFVYSFLM